MPKFIELTTPEGPKFLLNIDLIENVIDRTSSLRDKNKRTYILGVSTDIYCSETYDEIKELLESSKYCNKTITTAKKLNETKQ